MALDLVTYESLRNVVVNWIKSNCSNIVNYNGINNSVKNGYSYQIGSSSSGSAYSERAIGTISSPLTSAISASQVDTDMNNFWTLIGSPSGNISPDNFYKIINDLCCFCATKLAFITSQSNNSNASSVKYLIYWANNNNYKFQEVISSSSLKLHLIKASDVNMLISNLINMMCTIEGTIRIVPCKYNFSFG